MHIVKDEKPNFTLEVFVPSLPIHQPIPNSVEVQEKRLKIELQTDSSTIIPIAAPLTQVIANCRKAGAINVNRIGVSNRIFYVLRDRIVWQRSQGCLDNLLSPTKLFSVVHVK